MIRRFLKSSSSFINSNPQQLRFYSNFNTNNASSNNNTFTFDTAILIPIPNTNTNINTTSATQTHTRTHTLHEESAGGINGRFARMSQTNSPTELLTLYSKLSPSDLIHLNTISFNHVLEAMLQTGKQIEAFKLINDLERRPEHSFPDKSTFKILMKGLVEADSSGSLALTVDEIFELMQKKYLIEPDLEAWNWRIRAFLHHKYTNSPTHPHQVSKVFYNQMYKAFPLTSMSPHSIQEMNELRADLVVTAVNRRLWSFAEWMFDELLLRDPYPDTAIWEKIANAAGLFTDPACIPIIRHLQDHIVNSLGTNANSVLNSVGLNTNILLFAYRQGRLASDLALHALRYLVKNWPEKMDWWVSTAEGCLRRSYPRDLECCEGDEARNKILGTIERVGCKEGDIREFEQYITHLKLLQ